MKLVLFNEYRLGLLMGDQVVDVSAAVEGVMAHSPQEMMEAVIRDWSDFGPRIKAEAVDKEGVPVEQVRLRPPLPRPGKILCAAVNYLEFGQRRPADLDAFLKSPEAVIGPGDTVVLPPAEASIFHHEAELGVVMGRQASRVPRDRAMDYVFGYVNFIDVSARGLNPNGRTSHFLGKCWDTFAPMGPAIVTADEVPDPHNLQVRLWVNGQLRHDFPTSDMAHNIPELIEFMSGVVTLRPGDLIATGTNHQGIGPVQDGDTVVMEVQGLGRLTVNVQDPLKRRWPHDIDREFARMVLGR